MSVEQERHFTDENGMPTGGFASAPGVTVVFQDGPLGPAQRRSPQNGAMVEDLLEIVAGRLRHFQDSRFACWENEQALSGVETALKALHRRTARREGQGVEGTAQGT